MLDAGCSRSPWSPVPSATSGRSSCTALLCSFQPRAQTQLLIAHTHSDCPKLKNKSRTSLLSRLSLGFIDTRETPYVSASAEELMLQRDRWCYSIPEPQNSHTQHTQLRLYIFWGGMETLQEKHGVPCQHSTVHAATPGAGFPVSPTATAILLEALWHSLCSSALAGLAVQHTLHLAKVGVILNLYWKRTGLDAAFRSAELAPSPSL